MSLLGTLVSDQLRPDPDSAPVPPIREEVIGRSGLVVETLDEFVPLVPGELKLGTLSDSRVRVVTPIRVRLFEDHGQVVAEATDLNEFGFGSNISEAIRDIQRAVAQLYFSLEETREHLGSDLQATWSVLQKIVVTPKTPG